MNPTSRLDLLLSDILHHEPSSTTGFRQGSLLHASPLLTFAEHDYHPSITAIPSPPLMAPLPPHRNPSSLKHHRQRHHIHQSDKQKQQQQTQPLLNSSTLDDLFRALTLECEQYLAASSTSYEQNQTHDEFLDPSPSRIQTNIDSNDDDYENLHSANITVLSGISPLRTSIEVISPEKRQIVSVNVSSKLTSSPIVSSSQTYPLLSTTTSLPPMNCHSSDDDSLDISTASTHRKRRRRTRKHQILSPSFQSNSSSDERTETMSEKKSIISKRSCSTDHRQQRIKSIYDNQPISLSSQKYASRRIRRRDISLQQNPLNSTRHYEDISPRFPENICSPLSVLLTSARPSSDFVEHSQQQQQQSRRSRVEFINHQPLTILDRMHHQLYQASPTRYNNHNTGNIPTHRIPSYPVY